MSNLNVVYEKIHYRHDPRWQPRLGPAAGSAELCVACAIEMMESAEVSSVRKSVALVCVGGVLKRSPGVLKDVLLQDHRVCLHFIASLMGMLHAVKDEATLEQTIQGHVMEVVLLVPLLLELQSEEFVQCVLQEIHTQLCEQSSVRGFLPTFTFLGKLIDAVPALPQILAAQHAPLLEQLCAAFLFPDEALKSSVCYIFRGVWGCEGAGQSLPPALRDRLCALLLQTLSSASTPHLTVNCLGFLKQLLKLGEVVSVLMNCHSESDCAEDLDLEQNSQPHPKPCSLPLILKKLLLSGEETLQVASAQSMAAVLVQSPSQYCPLFIQADVPEFLYERLCSRSEVLLWSVYSCLLLLMEDPLFFSQCHSVYGIESLIRSLKEALRMNNQDVQRQGLLLLTETLEKQPAGVRLFPSGPGFAGVAEVVVGGVSSPCLQVATQAAHAAAALFRLNHQSSPVLYKELKGLVETVIGRCTELPLPTATHRRAAGSLTGAEPSTQYSRAGAFLLQALVCFHAACRLAEQCAGEPELQENAFTAPDAASGDSLQSFCLYLLHCCDSVCIPTVTRHCERAASPAVLVQFFSVLSCQFCLVPSLMPLFSNKLASSGFFRLTLERKAAFCVGNRNAALNTACSDFLRRLCLSLLSQLDTNTSSHQQDCEELAGLLERCLPALCCRPSEWPSLLCEAPGPTEGEEGPRATQYCLLILLYLALQHGDRLLPDPAVFSCVVALLRSVQEQGGRPPPPSVLRAALYLLSITQDHSPELDWASLNCIIAAVSTCPSFSSPFCPPHPALLHFVFRYPELADRFGPAVLELWLTHRPAPEVPDPRGPDRSPDVPVLLSLVEKNPATLLSLLGVMCSSDSRLAGHALGALRGFLLARPSCDPTLSKLLRPLLLQVLQRLAVEGTEGQGVLGPVPLVLQLLCLIQSSVSALAEMDCTDFKLLHHVSNLAGKLKASNTESLLPALNYLYCSAGLCPPHCANRAVSVLLCNNGLMDQLQALLNLCPASSSSSSLLCCSRLLLSTLVHLQRVHSAQVHKCITLSLDNMIQLVCFRKRKMDSLSLASALRLLQAALDVDLQSPLLALTVSPSAQRPLLDTEAALHPLGSHGAQCLISALYGLLLEKQEFLLIGSVSCLRSLLVFLGRKSPDTALHAVCQPWSRFLLFSLLSCGGAGLLHPAVLQLLELLVRFSSKAVLWEPDLVQVLEAAESRDLKELGGAAAQTLSQLLTQLLGSHSHQPPTQKHRERVQSLLDTLGSLPPTDSQDHRLLYPFTNNVEIYTRAASHYPAACTHSSSRETHPRL
ncbi:meiosis inhibitor protein 1-like isoform X3 [Anguilla anguilla]|uniref:meiosis inhibitor protein 1-like isoform X3 n=1 Tax=Anguilla anguilla TaxID=7936 RepID=UPI0015A7BE98|nr:meiosis inhibitor protein 1-like isoform X3 [Anguilla anguilla]